MHESESIEILREAIACARNPVMLYSMGKDSTVLLHLARKAFYPSPLPFPLLHVDTTWKFREMYVARQELSETPGVRLIVHVNRQGLADGVDPFKHDSSTYTRIMKTDGLKQALNAHGYDLILGGARRDEEASRAKERIFSVRAAGHHWDPRSQRPELWRLYNTHLAAGQTMRVFPLSNWTEFDVWHYIYKEQLDVVPLYFARDRPVVRRNGQWIMLDDSRLPLAAGEKPQTKRVRFRSLGCYPLSAAIESEADSLESVLEELLDARASERQGRLIDKDQPGSMEHKKQEGYF